MRNLLSYANRITFFPQLYASYLLRVDRFLKILTTIAPNLQPAQRDKIFFYIIIKDQFTRPSIYFYDTPPASPNWIIKILNLFAVELFGSIRHQ